MTSVLMTAPAEADAPPTQNPRNDRRWLILAVLVLLYLIWTLPALTKIVVVAWLAFGLLIYFTYSVKHSKVQQALREETVVGTPPPAALR